jgi:hypothetical protein
MVFLSRRVESGWKNTMGRLSSFLKFLIGMSVVF